MIHYETLILSRPDAASDELDNVLKGFEKIVTSGKGVITATDSWGKLHLAYPIEKNDYGMYTLLRYEVPAASVNKVLAEITSFFRVNCSESVYRHTTTRNKSGTPGFVYKRPEASEAGKGNLDSFLKENKIDGFLGGSITGDEEDIEA